ncbi:helix-turn-helix domain-containing protein [Aeromonas veronii bv. sobria]|uniref:helix-turn-helix domain-containing protein n=1 Tax=Aeromonas veronii TaxID=654 RepID=UPI0035C06EED
MDDLSLTAAELRDIRARLDWSQQRMADELGVARNTVNRMEQGRMAVERRTALAVRYLAWHHAMIEKVSRQQPGQETAPVSARERGDGHKQVDLPLPAVTHSKRSLIDNANEAWEVYKPAIWERQGDHLLRDSYFKLIQTSKTDYSYLFLLQLLERLLSLPVPWNSCAPFEWIELKALRAFTDKLYKANPQWH